MRLSSTLVPLGRTCTVGRHFMNNLPYLRLIFNGYILIVCSPPFVQTKQHHTQGALSHFFWGGGMWAAQVQRHDVKHDIKHRVM